MTANSIMQAVSLVASGCLLAAYRMLLRERWAPLSWPYLSVNGLAGLLFLVVGLYDWRLGGITTNAVFLGMNVHAMGCKKGWWGGGISRRISS